MLSGKWGGIGRCGEMGGGVDSFVDFECINVYLPLSFTTMVGIILFRPQWGKKKINEMQILETDLLYHQFLFFFICESCWSNRLFTFDLQSTATRTSPSPPTPPSLGTESLISERRGTEMTFSAVGV